MVQLDLYIDENFTKFCLPANYDQNKLDEWNQKRSPNSSDNPWLQAFDWSTNKSRVATCLINSGSLVYFHRGDGVNNQTESYTEFAAVIPVFHQWSHDKINHKFQFEFYLDNDLEETNPTEIYDDDETFWSAFKSGSGSFDITLSEETTIVKKGTSSLKGTISTGSYQSVGISHVYGGSQDWSSKEFFCFWWYGVNTSSGWRWRFGDDAGMTNSFYYDFTDNFTGWKRFVVPLRKMPTLQGTPSWSTIGVIDCYTSSPIISTSYLDRIVIDIGQWVKVDVFIPDLLTHKFAGTSVAQSWDGSNWRQFMYWASDTDIFSFWTENAPAMLYFLDGTRVDQIYAGRNYYQAWYNQGKRGETFSPKTCNGQTVDGVGNITYSSYYGCKNRLGFAIKMPPHDGLSSEAGGDSSTTGISQCRIQLQIVYDRVEDTSGNENHGTRYDGTTQDSGPTSVDGKYGKALSFDGYNDEVRCGTDSDFNITNDLTLEAWVKTLDNNGGIIFKGNDSNTITFEMGNYANYLFFRQGDASNYIQSNLLINDDLWHHIVITRNGNGTSSGALKFYMDGVAGTESQLINPPNSVSDSPLKINNSYGLGKLAGLIDEVRVYNRILSLSEIQENMKGGNHVTRNGLVGEWKMEFGRATYEFENSTNTFYGLQNIQPPSGHTLTWSCIFNPTTSQYDYYIHDTPIGLEITADENEKINKMILKFNSGSSIIKRGKKCGPYLSQDKDSDNIPNVFDEQEAFLPE